MAIATTTTTRTRRAILGAIAIGTAAIAIGAPAAAPTAGSRVSPQLAALLTAQDQADAASEAYERDVYDPLRARYSATAPLSAALEAPFEECNRLSDAVTAACDAIAAFPVVTLADLHAKTQRLIHLGYFDVDGVPEKIAADIDRLAAREV